MSYQPIPVDAAVEIATAYQKQMVLIVGIDQTFNQIHFTTYGVSPNDKLVIADIADRIGNLIGETEPTRYEDFRFVNQARRAAQIRDLLEACKATENYFDNLTDWSDIDGDEREAIRNQLQSAIAKAEGK